MNATRSNNFRGLAFAGVAVVFFTFGTVAQACSFGSSSEVKSGLLAKSGLGATVEVSKAKAEAAPSAPFLFLGAVTGLWQVTFSSGGQVVDMAYEVFHIDGTEELNDITPPAQGNVCFGLWVQTSLNGYTLTHPAWDFDANGNLLGTVMETAKLTLVSLNEFTGTITLSYFDLKGNPGPVLTGTLTATRIQPGN